MIYKAFSFSGTWKCILRQVVRGQIATCSAPGRKQAAIYAQYSYTRCQIESERGDKTQDRIYYEYMDIGMNARTTELLPEEFHPPCDPSKGQYASSKVILPIDIEYQSPVIGTYVYLALPRQPTYTACQLQRRKFRRFQQFLPGHFLIAQCTPYDASIFAYRIFVPVHNKSFLSCK